MNISQLSKNDKVRKLNEKDASSILKLQTSNPLYFEYCTPEPSIQNLLEDMTAFSPGKILGISKGKIRIYKR